MIDFQPRHFTALLSAVLLAAILSSFVLADTVTVRLYKPSDCTTTPPPSCSGGGLKTCTFNTVDGTSGCQFNYDFTNKCGQRGWHKSYAGGHGSAGPQNVYYCGCRNWGGVDSGDCNPSDGPVCTNPNVWENRDYYCNNGGSCAYNVVSSENCASKPAENINDAGDAPLVAGSCRDYNGCSGGACSYVDNADSCSGNTLTEYNAVGAACNSRSYGCTDFEVAAIDTDGGDNPALNGQCGGGVSAGCGSGAFSTGGVVNPGFEYKDGSSERPYGWTTVWGLGGISVPTSDVSRYPEPGQIPEGTYAMRIHTASGSGSLFVASQRFDVYPNQEYNASALIRKGGNSGDFRIVIVNSAGTAISEQSLPLTSSDNDGWRFVRRSFSFTTPGSSTGAYVRFELVASGVDNYMDIDGVKVSPVYRDACTGTCGTGNNSCMFREWFVADSADGCGGSDTCASKTYDPDTNSNTCTTCGLTWGLPGETGSLCTGDDSREFVRWRQCAPGSCISDVNDRAACFSQSSCVIKGRCLTDIDDYAQEKCRGENNDTDECKKGKRRGARSGPDRDKIYNDTDNDGRLEVCDPGTWLTPTADSVKGRVVTVGGFGVDGAEVRILGTNYVTLTANISGLNGSYDFGSNVVNSSVSYDIVASRSPYSPSVLKDVFIPDFEDVTVPNITLSYGSDLCEEDCTLTSDETCHASCQGTNGCLFYDTNAAGICDAVHTGFRVDYDATREVQCCEGSPYVPVKIKATTKINATNVVRITRNVWYEGKLVKMVIDVFS